MLSYTEHVDLRRYPEITPSPDMTEVSMGDLHANVMYFLNILVRQGIVAILKEQYDRFVKFYTRYDLNSIWCGREPAPVFKKESEDKRGTLTRAREEFDEILKTIQVLDTKKMIRLIGDELVDGSVNDYFMLAFMQHLDNQGTNFEILLSNLCIEFVKACERFEEQGNKLVAARLDNRGYNNSFYALNETIKAGVVSHEEVLAIYHNVYKRHLKCQFRSKNKTLIPINAHLHSFCHT